MIRQAAALPVGHPDRKALLKVLAAKGLDAELLATIQKIHDERRVRPTQEKDIAKAYSVLDNAGEGYSDWEEDDDIDSITDLGKYLGSVKNNQIAVYMGPKVVTLVGDKSGPWAVDIKVK
jgi:hypothetical protein